MRLVSSQSVYCEQTVALFYDAATENLPPAFGLDDGSIRALIQAGINWDKPRLHSKPQRTRRTQRGPLRSLRSLWVSFSVGGGKECSARFSFCARPQRDATDATPSADWRSASFAT